MTRNYLLVICVKIAGLSKEVKGADAQLRDLRRTVEYVENNRDSFSHIDNVSGFGCSACYPARLTCWEDQRAWQRRLAAVTDLVAYIRDIEAFWY